MSEQLFAFAKRLDQMNCLNKTKFGKLASVGFLDSFLTPVQPAMQLDAKLHIMVV